MLVVVSKQALNEPGHEEPIPLLISEITQISVNAHLAHHSESYCPRQVPELCEERGGRCWEDFPAERGRKDQMEGQG